MKDCPYPIAALIPHKPPMILLDEVICYDENSLVAEVTIRDDSLFLRPEGVPCHVGIEYMAQACGAYAGVHALDSGDPVRIGLLLGTRDYRAQVSHSRRGDRLQIAIEMVFRDEAIAALAFSISITGKIVAEAQLKVYQPNNDELAEIGS